MLAPIHSGPNAIIKIKNKKSFSVSHSFTSPLSFQLLFFFLDPHSFTTISMFSSVAPLLLSGKVIKRGYGDVCHEMLLHPFFRDLRYSRRRKSKKYNNTLSACSLCQTFKPPPISLKQRADKGALNQIRRHKVFCGTYTRKTPHLY